MDHSLTVNGIIAGAHDDLLDLLSDAIIARRKMQREQHAIDMRVQLQPGDRVALRNIRPQYMVGAVGTLVRVADNNTAIVDLPHSGRYGGETRVSLSCIVPA